VIEKVRLDHTLVVTGINQPVINAASFDFLGLSRDPSLKASSLTALDHYGVGSCGPRGFYGTIDLHLQLEHALAQFLQVDEAICYSEGASATTSAIQAFAKKGDLLIIDEACSEPILSGANLSRATIRYFKHNDMSDLRRILSAIREEDKLLRRDTSQQRRFIVVEGIYRNTGDICPLLEIVQLRKEFFYRIILDESLSFGVLGAQGRGLTEQCNIPPMEIDIVTFALDTVLASVGGVCVGTREIVDHQRLSGAGYCFSASSAPFLSAAALSSLQLLQSETFKLQAQLLENVRLLRQELAKIPVLVFLSNDETPVIHLALRQRPWSTHYTTSSSTQDGSLSPDNTSIITSSAFSQVQLSAQKRTPRKRQSSGKTLPATSTPVIVSAVLGTSSSQPLITIPTVTDTTSSSTAGVSEPPAISTTYDLDWPVILDITNECLHRGVGVVANKFAILKGDMPPSIMITVNAAFTEQEIVKIAKVVAAATKMVTKAY
jgi:serine palmitoyltransferase